VGVGGVWFCQHLFGVRRPGAALVLRSMQALEQNPRATRVTKAGARAAALQGREPVETGGLLDQRKITILN